MLAQTTSYSSDFQSFLQLVDKSLAQAADDARELAERTGTPLVVRDVRGNQSGNTIENNAGSPLDTPAEAIREPE